MVWHSSWDTIYCDFSSFSFVAENHTQYLEVKNNIIGSAIRVRFNNQNGREPLVLVSAVLRVGEKTKNILLGGERVIRIEPGSVIYSDKILISAGAGDEISVKTKNEGVYPLADAALYIMPGIIQYESDEGFRPANPSAERPEQLQQMNLIYGIDRVEVQGELMGEVAFFGDSITQMGFWSDPLALKLYEQYPGKVTTFNRGIGGNRLLHDSPPLMYGSFGKAAVRRFETDVFGEKSQDLVIVHIGINDLCHPILYNRSDQIVDADAVIKGLTKLADLSHKHGARAVCCTLLPFKGYEVWNSDMEAKRRQVNEWVCSNEVFDSYLDFDAMLRDAGDTEKMDRACHVGDWLHPNPIGGAKIAGSIDCAALMRMANEPNTKGRRK